MATAISNGSITVRNRKLSIWWNGEHAQHVAKNYIEDNVSHPHLHIRIQQLASTGKYFKQGKSNVVMNQQGLEETFFIPFYIVGTFAVIKTCYLIQKNMQQVLKDKNISGAQKSKTINIYVPVFIKEQDKYDMANDLDMSVDEMEKWLIKILNEKPGKRKRN